MSERALAALARAAGLATAWRDPQGVPCTASVQSQRAVLRALGLAADTPRQIADSHAALKAGTPTPMQVVQAGSTIDLGLKRRAIELIGEDGTRLQRKLVDGILTAPDEIGYYALEDGRRLAVTPRRAFSMRDVSRHKLWGVAAQLYSLRGSAGFGDFGALAKFATQAAAAGASAIAISPVHALFTADLTRYSPYGPSSRLFLNSLYGAARETVHDTRSALIDWPTAGATKLRALRAQFEHLRGDADMQRRLRRFIRDGGERLLSHARFEVLDDRFRPRGLGHWRDWPAPFADARSAAVGQLKADDPAIAFQLFLQWNADRSLAAAQSRARDSGMAIGLIADMAIGVDPAGSQAWSAPAEMLPGLSIGAPPDLFTAAGQNWGLTTFSPHGLRAQGYAGFIATLRAAMRHAGGIRLDHAMGLQRLWVVPEGAPVSEGLYLRYPMRELLGLLALESQRHRAIVIAEDLGTVPAGFRRHIARAGLHGMRILWFERDGRGEFLPPARWDASAAALSTTHDLPTIAGWWRGRDLTWRSRVGLDKGDGPTKARQRDRRALWRALKKAACASGPMPPPEAAADVADAALKFLAATSCRLALVPVEDIIGAVEQPNLPSTIDQHPNWRRRLADDRPFAGRRRKARIKALNQGRDP